MKRMLILGLALVLILGMAGTAMAGSDKVKEIKSRVESQLQVHSEEADEAEEKAEEEAEAKKEAEEEAKEKAEEEAEEAEEKDDEKEEKEEEEGPSQGAVHCLLVIDYKVPGNGNGTMTLIATRGSVEQTFEAQIPWGLNNKQAMEFIREAFGSKVEEAFGLRINSFKVMDFEFDEETSVTTATLLAIHGKAPIKLPKGLRVSEESHGHGESKHK